MKKVININEYRYQKEGPKKKPKVGLVILSLVLFIITLFSLCKSPIFNIRDIVVEGNKQVSVEKVKELSAISVGQNIFDVDSKGIVEKLNMYPMIESSSVEKKLPGELRLKIVERKPVGIIVTNDGFIQVSQDARFLSLQHSLGDYQLPVLSGINLDELPGPGQVIENDNLNIALQIIQQCGSESLEIIAEINVGNQEHILAYTNQGMEIRLGSQGNFEQKMDDLNDILTDLVDKQIPESSIEYIDLRFSGPPIIKQKAER